MTPGSSPLETKFAAAEDSPGFMLWKAANVLQRAHAASLRDLDITPTQLSLLTCLVYLQGRGPVTASAVVAHSGMDKMLVSDLVAALVRKRLVSKSPNPDDARSTLIKATALGVRTTNAAVKKVEAFDDEFFAPLPDLAALHRALKLLVEHNGRG